MERCIATEKIISGNVIEGKKKGTKLGFPTANIKLEENLESGVFVGVVILGKKRYKAAVFIGLEGDILEAHISDFSGDLYGKKIEIEIGEKIRDVIKFENDEDLKKQILDDIEIIKNITSKKS